MDHSHHHDHAHHDHSQHMNMNMVNATVIPQILTSTVLPTVNVHAHHNHADMIASGGGANDNIDHDHHSGHNAMNHMMMMAFHFGYDETILFEQWKINSIGGLIGSMLAIFVMATVYEGLKYYREYLFWKTYNLLEYRPVAIPKTEISNANAENNVPSAVHFVGEVLHKQPPSMFSLMHFYQTFLHLIQVTLSFLLMLIFMTYNVWLCLAVVLGAGFGYYLFCWKKSVIVDVTEHCH
ncbi:high affinity copper uptake protein 1-like isoform X2 [Condylostylus longicornis]|uniref:high affinity copper uptake protein 1-like isoform X2 n=1 Tax=Condylostylus longicornis TaxID=2530218 RepID=UPI00244DA195|nr:high affinity copper uptake protein 1-like isoform X2 [Condylostylus longicornis]XP_055376986.1 high affinity copper uptake protein 1-like isoform X2 [Condylostylus longicornis]